MGRPKGSKNKPKNIKKRYCYGYNTSPKTKMLRKAARDIVVNTTSIALGVLIALVLWDVVAVLLWNA